MIIFSFPFFTLSRIHEGKRIKTFGFYSYFRMVSTLSLELVFFCAPILIAESIQSSKISFTIWLWKLIFSIISDPKFLFGEYLDIQDISGFNVAICNHAQRNVFLDCIGSIACIWLGDKEREFSRQGID
jgi:hypothetical protein